jgi:hypothetical protein
MSFGKYLFIFRRTIYSSSSWFKIRYVLFDRPLTTQFSLNYTTMGDVHRPVFETKKTEKAFKSPCAVLKKGFI